MLHQMIVQYDINLEVMQIEQNTVFQEYSIEKYHHRINNNPPLDPKRQQIIIIKKGCLSIAYRNTPEKSQDVMGFENVGKINYFQPKDTVDITVVVIKLKSQDKATISFRVSSTKIATQIIEVINNKVHEFNKLPDYCDLLFQKQAIIDKIKESQPQYKEVYKVFSKKISTPKLRAILFQNHRVMMDYNAVALAKGFQIDKTTILTQIKDKPKQPPFRPQILQGYDIAKTLQGVRLQDDQKKLKFTPNLEDVDEQLFFSSLPDVKEKNIWDEFEKIGEEKMQIQSEQRTILQKQSDLSKVNKIILPKPVKGKYKISQSKEIFDRNYMKQQKRKQQRVQLNIDFAKRVTLTLKLFYKLSKYNNTTFEQITHIENQIYRLLNSQPKPAPFLEIAINKAVKNILKWKRENQ